MAGAFAESDPDSGRKLTYGVIVSHRTLYTRIVLYMTMSPSVQRAYTTCCIPPSEDTHRWPLNAYAKPLMAPRTVRAGGTCRMFFSPSASTLVSPVFTRVHSWVQHLSKDARDVFFSFLIGLNGGRLLIVVVAPVPFVVVFQGKIFFYSLFSSSAFPWERVTKKRIGNPDTLLTCPQYFFTHGKTAL